MSDTFDPRKLSVSQQIAVLGHLHQQAAAWAMGIGVRTLRDRGAVIPRDADGKYSACDLFAWIAGQVGETAADPELAGPNSPALERFRKARAELVEYDVKLRTGTLMDRAEIHEGLGLIAGIYRRVGERLRREFGDEAYQIVDECWDDATRQIEVRFGEGSQTNA